MIEFHNIETKDLDKISNIIRKNHIISSLYSTYNLYALRKKYHTKIACYKDTLFIRQSARDLKEYNSYLFPIGENDLKNSIDILYDHADSKKHKLMIWGLTYEMVNELERILPNSFVYEEILDWGDYIYNRENLINGKMLKKGRKFHNNYQGKYVVEEISENNLEEIIKFQNKWMENNIDNNENADSLKFEHDSIIETLLTWGRLKLKGYCIKVNGNVVAFTYGFLQTSDCFMLHVIKTDKTIKGLSLFIFKCLVESVNTKYINFEEDIGIQGLRTFKTRLKPEFILKKYRAIIK